MIETKKNLDGMLKLAVAITLSSLVLLAFCLGFGYWLLPSYRGEISMEIVKSLLQLTLVVGIGALTSFLFRRHEGQRKKQEEERLATSRQAELRRTFLQRFLQTTGKAYREVKSVRRQLRAAGLTSKYGLPPTKILDAQREILNEKMQRLNAVQLDLEGIKKEVRYLPQFAGLTQLEQHFRAMEKYLRKILSEFEEWNGKRTSQANAEDGEGQNRVTGGERMTLARLEEFTSEFQYEKDFNQKFSKQYSDILKLLGQEMAGAESTTENVSRENRSQPDALDEYPIHVGQEGKDIELAKATKKKVEEA